MTEVINFIKLPKDGSLQNKGAKKDPSVWKVVPMNDDPSKFKIVDDNSPPLNVAHQFNSESTAQQFIEHHRWIKNNPCPPGQVHDPETGTCITPKQETSASGSFGNQFIRNMSGRSAGCIEIQSKGEPPEENVVFGPANGLIHIEAGIPSDIVGMKGDGDSNSDEITIIYKENHGKHEKKGKHNVKVTLKYKGKSKDNDAEYTGDVELGVEDDHDVEKNPKKLQGVKYQNTEILTKYKTGFNNPIRAKGSYQDTADGGVRYKLEVQDPDTKEWKKIFDHVDYGDENHKIENYRGASAYCSAIRTDGHANGFDEGGQDNVEKILRPLYFKSINEQMSEEQKNRLSKLGYGSIRVQEIEPDNSDLHDGQDDPLSFGKKEGNN
jgi:hypothetical protein